MIRNRQVTELAAEGNVSDLIPLVRYIAILANKYPRPLSHKDLAEQAHVSKAAVSKVRDRIYAVCDDRWLGRRRRLLLRTDTKAAVQIFSAFFFVGNLKPLIKSAYGKALVEKSVQGYYRKAAKAMPELQEFFEQEDATFVSGLVLEAVAESVSHLNFTTLDTFEGTGAQSVIAGYVITIMNRLGPNLQRCLKDERTLSRILALRDRAWFFLLQAIDSRLELIFKDFLEQIEDNQTRSVYLSVYRQTIIFYLKRAVFEFVTLPIKSAANKRKIRFEEEFVELGHFFQPSSLPTSP